jgi:protein O-mannosyl-transferase
MNADVRNSDPQSLAPNSSRRWQVPAVSIALLLAVWAVFGQTIHHEFVNFDDSLYIFHNPLVVYGLTWHTVVQAFRDSHGAAWIPLTWISHMIDWDLYGSNAGGHHLTNVLVHALVTIFLFLALWRMTEGVWPSALAAALFAIHPLRAESVAWVTERKGLLSGLFFMLTLLAYIYYSRHRFSAWRYALVLLAFALGLLAKPILVTVPLVLFLLDYWPLGRISGARVLWEKLPLLVLAAWDGWMTLSVQGLPLAANQTNSLSWRIGNALVSYVGYLRNFACPWNLVIEPPERLRLSPWAVATAAAVLIGITAAAIIWRRRCPYLVVGWFWYLIMLLPVIGLLPFGICNTADRFTYLPTIGLCVALAWGAFDLCQAWPHRLQAYAVAAALLVLLILGGNACCQTYFWHDSVTLWSHSVEGSSGNWLAHNNLGNALIVRGDWQQALEQFQETLAIEPNYLEARVNAASMLAALGHADEAAAEYRKALQITAPGNSKTFVALGDFLLSERRLVAALSYYRGALEIDPHFAPAYARIGKVHAQNGQDAQAISEYEESLRLAPDSVEALNDLAWLRATSPKVSLRNGPEAIRLARRADDLSGRQRADVLDTLAAAYAEAGRFAEAVATARTAIELARQHREPSLANLVQKRIARYEARTPLSQAEPSSEVRQQWRHPLMAPAKGTTPLSRSRNGPG